ncbi:UNVERIFIED_CONTAM: hypothetical protein FKN15_077910 [Acipenser sinensis]
MYLAKTSPRHCLGIPTLITIAMGSVLLNKPNDHEVAKLALPVGTGRGEEHPPGHPNQNHQNDLQVKKTSSKRCQLFDSCDALQCKPNDHEVAILALPVGTGRGEEHPPGHPNEAWGSIPVYQFPTPIPIPF